VRARNRLRLTLVACLGTLATAIATFALSVATNNPAALPFADTLRNYPFLAFAAFLVITLATTVPGLWAQHRGTSDEEQNPTAIASLAKRTYDQWNVEGTRRKLFEPYVMPLSWITADPELMADWKSIVLIGRANQKSPGNERHWATGPSELAGSGANLAAVLDKVPTRRLVILGEPGAGKTSLLVQLINTMLKPPWTGERVPVLFPMSDWRPLEEDLLDWMERWLSTGSGLAGRTRNRNGMTRARRLIESGHILPRFDGLDEIPKAARAAAIAKINAATGFIGEYVLTARSIDYRAAVLPDNGPEVRLAGAAGIEVCPLTSDDAVEFVRADIAAGTARWDSVLERLRTDPLSPAAQALSTPLMAQLARTVYYPRSRSGSPDGDDPGVLLDKQRFPHPASVEAHLFDGFLPAAYSSPNSGASSRWSADQARGWLMFLARHVPDGNLEWWQFQRLVPRWLPAVAIGVSVGVCCLLGFSFPLSRGFGVGSGAGIVTIVVAGALVRRLRGSTEYHITRALVGGLVGNVLAVAVVGVVARLIGAGLTDPELFQYLGNGLAYAIASATLGTFLAGCVGTFAGQVVILILSDAVPEVGRARGPGSMLFNGLGLGLIAAYAVWVARRDKPAQRGRLSKYGLIGGTTIGATIGVVVWFIVGHTEGVPVGGIGTVVGGLVGGLVAEVTPVDTERAASPLGTLRDDRATFNASWLGLGVGVGITTGLAFAFLPTDQGRPPGGLGFGITVGLATLVAVGLTGGFIRASWAGFAIARSWLALTGKLPWHLFTFLDDAHQRGVLRQVGAVYQFGHGSLRSHLSGHGLPDEPPGCPRVLSQTRT
jgi:hypothetical protein